MLMTSFGLKRFTGVLYSTAWYSPHEAVTARQAPFRTRRGSGTRLMKQVLISAHTRAVSLLKGELSSRVRQSGIVSA